MGVSGKWSVGRGCLSPRGSPAKTWLRDGGIETASSFWGGWLILGWSEYLGYLSGSPNTGRPRGMTDAGNNPHRARRRSFTRARPGLAGALEPWASLFQTSDARDHSTRWRTVPMPEGSPGIPSFHPHHRPLPPTDLVPCPRHTVPRSSVPGFKTPQRLASRHFAPSPSAFRPHRILALTLTPTTHAHHRPRHTVLSIFFYVFAFKYTTRNVYDYTGIPWDRALCFALPPFAL